MICLVDIDKKILKEVVGIIINLIVLTKRNPLPSLPLQIHFDSYQLF